jgi:hypothetical protein
MHIIPIAPISEQTDELHLARKVNLARIELQWTPGIIHVEKLIPTKSRF